MRALRNAVWLFAAAVLLGIAGVSAPVFLSASGTSLLHEQFDRHGEGLSALSVRVTSTRHPDTVRAADRSLRREVDRRGLSDVRRTAVASGTTAWVNERPRYTNLLAPEGGMQALPATGAGNGAPRVAITEMAAGQLGLDDATTLTLVGTRAALEVTVDAVVPDFDYFAMPAAWQPVASSVADDENMLTRPPAPALLTDAETLLALVAALDHGAAPPPVATRVPVPLVPVEQAEEEQAEEEQAEEEPAEEEPGGQDDAATDEAEPLTVAPTTVLMHWDVDAGNLATLAQARAASPEVVDLQAEIVDWNTEVGASMFAVTSRGWGSSGPLVGGQLVAALERTEAALGALSRPVRGLGVAGQVLALVVVAVAAVRSHRARLSRARLLAARGVSPLAVAARAALVAVPPVVVGVGVGWAAGLLASRALGVLETVGDDVFEALRRDAPLAVGAALLVVAVVVGVAAAVRARSEPGERRLPPVIEVAAVALAVSAWWGRSAGDPVLERSGGGAEVDVVAFALPLLLVVAIAAVGARLLRWLLARVTGLADRADGAWRWRGGVYLAFRRLRRLTGVTTLLVFVAAAGTGLLVVGGVLAASSDATIREKARVVVGADARLAVPRGELVDEATMEGYAALPVAQTLVRRIGDGLLDERREVDVLAVDPDELPGVAHQPATLDVDLATLLQPLSPAVEGQPLDAVVVGSGIPDGSLLRLPGLELPLRVVHRVPVFPGVTGGRPAVVVAAGGLLDPDDVVMRARLWPVTRTELWFALGGRSRTELRGLVTQAGLRDELEWADDLADDTSVAPVRATFAFVRGQAAVIGLLGLAALLLHQLGLARERALAAALVGRMGLRRRSLAAADAVESAVLVAGAALLGVGAGLLAARAVIADYDPMPDVPVPMVTRIPVDALWPGLLLAVVALAVTVLLARRSARSADVAAMLREVA